MSLKVAINRPVLSYLKHHLLSTSGSESIRLSSVRYLSVTRVRNMKLLQFTYPDKPDDIRAGILTGENLDNVMDINKSAKGVPSTILGILQKEGAMEIVQKIQIAECVPLSSVNVKAPIYGMDKVLCVGLNYHDHCREQNLQPPCTPMIFSKFSSSVVGPSEPVRIRTDVTTRVDWELELAVVIGKKASSVKSDDAYNYVLGYTIAQDISARDWQKEKNCGQFILGKSMDTFCPLGPWIVTRDEIPDPHALDMVCCLNGVLKQASNTCNIIHKIPKLIERISSVMTLLPGDIILTGTPGGVGMHRCPPEFLKPGDKLLNNVQGIGQLEVDVEAFKQ